MGELIEENSLRDKRYVFTDRRDAGRLLSQKLLKYKGSDSMILAIPSGGVPIACEIRQTLSLAMDLIIVRKIQIPSNPEAGFGAMSPDEEVILNERLLNQIGLTEEEMTTQIRKTRDVIKKRGRVFRQDKPFPSVENKIVFVVDDGLASGYTMRAAINFIKRKNPLKIIVAVPTASQKTADSILSEVDELICLNVRSGYPFAVADAYEDWYDVTDEEVLEILKKDNEKIKPGGTAK
jgi:predicted phosphoribosyltransferase